MPKTSTVDDGIVYKENGPHLAQQALPIVSKRNKILAMYRSITASTAF